MSTYHTICAWLRHFTNFARQSGKKWRRSRLRTAFIAVMWTFTFIHAAQAFHAVQTTAGMTLFQAFAGTTFIWLSVDLIVRLLDAIVQLEHVKHVVRSTWPEIRKTSIRRARRIEVWLCHYIEWTARNNVRNWTM